MSNLRLAAIAAAAFVLALAIGMAASFPGEALSRYISQQVERAAGMPVRLSPLHLGVTGLSAEALDILPPDSSPVFVREVHFPWTWRWISEIPLSAKIGDNGKIDVAWGWSGNLAVTLKDLALQDLPLPMLPPDTRLKGTVNAALTLAPVSLRQHGIGGMPAGSLELQAEGIEAINVRAAGIAIPTIRLDSVEARIGLGRTVQVESLTLRGDAEGTVTGTIVPNLERPADSRLSLNVALQVRRNWIDQLGNLKPLAEGFLPGGRIAGALEGTVGAPVLNRTAKRP